jgi:helix-turn-helix protein
MIFFSSKNVIMKLIFIKDKDNSKIREMSFEKIHEKEENI